MTKRTKLQKDGVRRVSLYGFPRAPRIDGDIVRARKVQVDMLDHLSRGEITQKRKSCPGSAVVHSSTTITPELDQRIHDYAVKRDCSRSAVVRQALMFYFATVAP